jgi:hypothetical protein
LRHGEFEEMLERGWHDPLDGGETFTLDMTDLENVDFDGALAAIRSCLRRA